MTTTVNKPSPAVEHMNHRAQKVRDLMGGTDKMRAEGEKYLPKFQQEEQSDYRARVCASWLFNGTRKTVRDMTGRVFDTPVELSEEAPQELVGWMSNADMQGRDLSQFSKQLFEDGLSGPGVSYVMVDAPRRDGVMTRAEAQRGNMRPYLVHLSSKEVLGWRAETVDNVMTLTQFRIAECVNERDPDDEFNDVEIQQVRVLDLIDGRVSVRIFREDEKSKKWVVVDEWTTELTEIMVAPFYANRTGFFTGEPLLDDLADINIAHWQSQSDQRHILHWARVPVLFASGYDDDNGKAPLIISASTAIVTSETEADLKWVEHGGKAIDSGRQDLKDLEFQMETFGLQLLVARQAAQSATGETLDAAKETSQLSAMADALQDCLEQCMIWCMDLGGIDGEASVKVNKEFGTGIMTAQELSVLLQAVNTGQLSRQTFLGEMARRGMIRADLNIDDEILRIEDEAPGMEVSNV